MTDNLDEALKVKQRERGYRESELVMGLVNNLVVGGDCLLDLEVLRGDPRTQALLGVTDVLAPTTAGEFLRKFDIGDIHDLRRVNQRVHARVRPQQPVARCTLHLDSSIYEQASTRKQGSTKAYTGEVGYPPLLAFWDEVGELVFSHLRRGKTHTHANTENRIKEHKTGFGLEKLPTRLFHANWAYLLIGQLAFNLVAWFKHLVLPADYHQATAKTIRHHLFKVAGKICVYGSAISW